MDTTKVGTIVHYKNAEGIIYPAIVIKNNEDKTIDAQVFGHTIFLKYGISYGKLPMQWDWRQDIEEEDEALEDADQK
jgi:hypothetical protein